MATSFWLDESKGLPFKNFDVAIVGAGITGLSSAYWLLKKDPDLRIALIEKGRIAFGASGRNAGFITCGSVEHFNRLVERWGRERANEIWQFSEENLRLIEKEIIKGDGAPLGFEKKGSFSLASTEAELHELTKTAELMRTFGIGVEELDSAAITKRVGAIHFAGGIKYLSDASVDPVKLCHKIYSLIKDKVTLFDHTEVYKTEQDGDQVKIYADKVRIEASMAVLSLNGYSANVDPYFADKIYPTRGQVLMMEPVPHFMEGPCYANFVLDYFRQIPTGELLIGGFRQLEKETEVGYSDHITPRIQTSLFEFVQKYLPQFEGAKVTHRWAGIMGFSADGQPMVGSLPNSPQVFFVGGYTGHGIGLAFHSAKCVADLIFGEEIPAFISARRF